MDAASCSDFLTECQSVTQKGEKRLLSVGGYNIMELLDTTLQHTPKMTEKMQQEQSNNYVFRHRRHQSRCWVGWFMQQSSCYFLSSYSSTTIAATAPAVDSLRSSSPATIGKKERGTFSSSPCCLSCCEKRLAKNEIHVVFHEIVI